MSGFNVRVRYWVFTSGEPGVSQTDWGMKFSSPSPFSSLPAASLSELQSLDREYRETVGAFGLDPRLQRPKGDFGLLLLPWSGGRVLLGFVLPHQDAHGRPNISLVGCVLDEETTSRLSPERAAALLWQKNPIAALGRGGVRPDDLVLSDAEPLEPSSCPVPELAWPTRDDGVLWIDGTALPLHRKEEVSLPTAPGGRVKPSRLPRRAALLGLALGAVLLAWYALSGQKPLGVSPPELPQELSFLNDITSEDVSDIFFTKAFVGEKKKEIAAESLVNRGRKWRANLFENKNENEILVEKKWFMYVVTQSLKDAMDGGIFTFLPEVAQGGSCFAPFFRWRFEDQEKYKSADEALNPKIGKGGLAERLRNEASQRAAQDSVRPGFTGEYVTKDMMIERVGRYVGGEGDKKDEDKKDEDKKEGYLVFLCEPSGRRPYARVYAINRSTLFGESYFVDVIDEGKDAETLLQCLDTQKLQSWDGKGPPPSRGPFWQSDKDTWEVNFLGVSLDASCDVKSVSADACIAAFAGQLYDSLISQ